MSPPTATLVLPAGSNQGLNTHLFVFVPDRYNSRLQASEPEGVNDLRLVAEHGDGGRASVPQQGREVVLYGTAVEFGQLSSKFFELTPSQTLLPSQAYQVELSATPEHVLRLPYTIPFGRFSTGTQPDSTAPARLEVASVELSESTHYRFQSTDSVDNIVLKLRSPIPEDSLALGWFGPVKEPIRFDTRPQLAMFASKGEREIRLPHLLTACLPFRVGLTLADASANYAMPTEIAIPLSPVRQPKRSETPPAY